MRLEVSSLPTSSLLKKPRGDPNLTAREASLLLQGEPTVSPPACRFPNLFPPLKPETVARKTVEAVQLNQALILLPWTMHALIILKRYGAGGESPGPASCRPIPLLPASPGGEEATGGKKDTGSISHVCCGRGDEDWWPVSQGFSNSLVSGPLANLIHD